MKRLRHEKREIYLSNVREIAAALGIEFGPDQYVELRDEGESLVGQVEIVLIKYEDFPAAAAGGEGNGQ